MIPLPIEIISLTKFCVCCMVTVCTHMSDFFLLIVTRHLFSFGKYKNLETIN